MAKSATLAIKIVGDASGAQKAMADTASATQTFKKELDRASLAAGGVLAGVGALAKQSFDAASNLEQMSGSVDAVFGKFADNVHAQAQDAASAVGLSAAAYSQMASLLGSQLKNAGVHGQALSDNVFDLITKASDMAAVFGGPTSDAVEALTAAMKGEFDPIEKYGVSLKQSAINAELARRHQDKLTGAAQRQAQVAAALAIVTRQTAQTTGQFAAQSNTAAEQQQQLSAAWQNAEASLGQTLLPLMVSWAGRLQTATTWATTHSGTVRTLAVVIGGLSAAVLVVNGAIKAYEVATKVAAAAQWLLNVAMDANPIGLLVIALAAVAAGVIYAYNKFSWFRTFVHSVGAGLASAFDGLKSAIGWVADKISWLVDKGSAVAGWIGNLFGGGHGSAPTGGTSGAVRGATRAMASPAVRGAVYGATSSLSGGGAGPSAAGRGTDLPAATTINITVQGAVDPMSTAKQIQSLLDRYAVRTGARPAVAR